MKRAKPNRKARTLVPTHGARDLTVTSAVGAGVKGGEEEEKKATPKLLEAAVKGKTFPRVQI